MALQHKNQHKFLYYGTNKKKKLLWVWNIHSVQISITLKCICYSYISLTMFFRLHRKKISKTRVLANFILHLLDNSWWFEFLFLQHTHTQFHRNYLFTLVIKMLYLFTKFTGCENSIKCSNIKGKLIDLID